MSSDKISIEHIIQVKREEIHTLDKKIAKLKEEINQIELENIDRIHKPSKNKRKYQRVLHVFNKIK